MTQDAERLLDAARRTAQSLGPAGLDQTLANITAAAVQVLPEVQMASITVRHPDGRLETFAPTDEALLEVDHAQYGLQEGPCYDAATDSVHVASPHLAADPRFPRYAEVANAHGIQSQAGVRLFDAKGSHGALNLYSRSVGSFQDLEALAELFAHQAAIALEYARHVDNLQQAIQTRQVIGQAVGMVMERYKLGEARAFAVLTRLSQEANVKLREIAQGIVAEREGETSES
ncbi:MAG: GAF and ANTAR domain-containing protein [Marmoricola sp.]